MDIILKGQHNVDEMVESLNKVLHLFQDKYQIKNFREIHLMVTLIDAQGEEVELVDSDTKQSYRIFEVYRKDYELAGKQGQPFIQLVVDNTK